MDPVIELRRTRRTARSPAVLTSLIKPSSWLIAPGDDGETPTHTRQPPVRATTVRSRQMSGRRSPASIDADGPGPGYALRRPASVADPPPCGQLSVACLKRRPTDRCSLLTSPPSTGQSRAPGTRTVVRYRAGAAFSGGGCVWCWVSGPEAKPRRLGPIGRRGFDLSNYSASPTRRAELFLDPPPLVQWPGASLCR